MSHLAESIRNCRSRKERTDETDDIETNALYMTRAWISVADSPSMFEILGGKSHNGGT